MMVSATSIGFGFANKCIGAWYQYLWWYRRRVSVLVSPINVSVPDMADTNTTSDTDTTAYYADTTDFETVAWMPVFILFLLNWCQKSNATGFNITSNA